MEEPKDTQSLHGMDDNPPEDASQPNFFEALARGENGSTPSDAPEYPDVPNSPNVHLSLNASGVLASLKSEPQILQCTADGFENSAVKEGSDLAPEGGDTDVAQSASMKFSLSEATICSIPLLLDPYDLNLYLSVQVENVNLAML